MIDLEIMGRNTRQAARLMAIMADEHKNEFLLLLADSLESRKAEIIAANQVDVVNGKEAGLSEALIDRLLLNEKRILAMSSDLRSLVGMPDPIGAVIDRRTLSSGVNARRQRVPLGVIAVIYEARPNVTVDISALGLKAGNVVILRGGKETMATNQCLVNLIHQALDAAGLPVDAVQFISDPDRRYVNQLVKMDQFIDILIPRGGKNLQDFCKREAAMPVMLGGIGICHIFVDASADLHRAVPVIYNAKVQRPSVCNALDTLLVHQAVAAEFLDGVVSALRPAGVSFRLDEISAGILGLDDEKGLLPAEAGDFDREWLSLVLGIKVVADLQSAIEHIWLHSTNHSDGILTENEADAERFVALVDSAVVYVNASTRFSDGSQLGLGGEVAVSTQRLHARGPIGLEGLTTYKWVLSGEYTVRA